MKALLKTIVVLAILAAVGYGVYRYVNPADEGPGPGFASGNGRLEATEVDISTKLAGRISQILVDEGDFVKTGQVLAVMQTSVLEAQLNEAKAQVAKAITAEASAKAQVGVKESDLEAAKATVLQRQSEFDQVERRFKRTSALTEEGVITEQQYDDDETSQHAARAAIATAQAQVGVAQAAVEAAKADAAGAAATIKAMEASVASTQADIDDSSLTAPRDGRVQYRVAQPGEVLGAGGRVLNLVDLSDVYVTFFLPEVQAGRVAIGSEARIILDSFPDHPIPAKISFVASVAQFTPKTVETESERQKLMFRVKAKIDPELTKDRLEMVKTGLPGVAWVNLDRSAQWPESLAVRTIASK